MEGLHCLKVVFGRLVEVHGSSRWFLVALNLSGTSMVVYDEIC